VNRLNRLQPVVGRYQLSEADGELVFGAFHLMLQLRSLCYPYRLFGRAKRWPRGHDRSVKGFDSPPARPSVGRSL
jgi:hypothetical protein